ncbi:phosphotransferase family protein [Streptomyces microflavus]
MAAALRNELDALALDGVEPRLLHHDLQAGHLVRAPRRRLLLDWELAAFGDPLSDPARLAVRLRLTDPSDAAALVRQPGPDAGRRTLYWHIHLLADAVFATDPAVRAFARARLT